MHLQASDGQPKGGSAARGFTLIEILVVIVILGILAAVVVLAVGGIQDRGEKSACQTEARTVRTAQEARYAEEHAYTADLSALASSGFLSETPSYVTAHGTAATTLTLQYTGRCATVAGVGTP